MRVYIVLRDQGKALIVDEDDNSIVKETVTKDGRNKTYSCEEAFTPDQAAAHFEKISGSPNIVQEEVLARFYTLNSPTCDSMPLANDESSSASDLLPVATT